MQQQQPGDLAVGAPGRRDLGPARARVDAVDLVQRLVQRLAVRGGGAAEQRPVDVEQQQQRRIGRTAQRAKDMPGSSRLANAAMSSAATWMSASETSSTGECM